MNIHAVYDQGAAGILVIVNLAPHDTEPGPEGDARPARTALYRLTIDRATWDADQDAALAAITAAAAAERDRRYPTPLEHLAGTAL